MATKAVELQAGPELDALIAEWVMGWEVRGPGNGPWVALTDPPSYPDITNHTFKPSTDIAAAWQVVEKMLATGWWMHVETDDSPGFEVGFESFSRDRVTAEAPTAPLAICRAALAAVTPRG